MSALTHEPVPLTTGLQQVLKLHSPQGQGECFKWLNRGPWGCLIETGVRDPAESWTATEKFQDFNPSSRSDSGVLRAHRSWDCPIESGHLHSARKITYASFLSLGRKRGPDPCFLLVYDGKRMRGDSRERKNRDESDGWDDRYTRIKVDDTHHPIHLPFKPSAR